MTISKTNQTPLSSNDDINEWNRNATTYAKAVGGAGDRIYQQFKDVLWESLGDVQGLAVLDLGCGHGWLSVALHQAGARVWGIDGSAELLQQARVQYPAIEFTEFDLAQGLPATNRQFDRIVANMVLMDIPDIEPVVEAVQKVIKPNGRFIFTLPHPCFWNYKSRRDPDTGALFRAVTGYHQSEVWRVASFGGHNHYHRSLTFYFETLRRNGFVVARLFEPEHIPRSDDPELVDFHRSIPVFILIEARSLPVE